MKLNSILAGLSSFLPAVVMGAVSGQVESFGTITGSCFSSSKMMLSGDLKRTSSAVCRLIGSSPEQFVGRATRANRVNPALRFALFSGLLVKMLLAFGGAAFADAEGDSSYRNRDFTVISVSGDHAYPPYEYLEDGLPTGFNIELIAAVTEALGIRMEVDLGPWKHVRQMLKDGSTDVLAGMYYSEERAETFAFSVPHTMVSPGLFVRDGSKIKELSDLRGRQVIVQEDDIMHDFLRSEQMASQIIAVRDPVKALRLLSSGEHDAALLSSGIQGIFFIRRLGLTNLTALDSGLPGKEYCFAVASDNKQLLHRLNEGLAIIKETSLYREIYDSWFGVYEEQSQWQRAWPYLWPALIVLSILALIGFGWSFALKRTVDRRTRELGLFQQRIRTLSDNLPSGYVYQLLIARGLPRFTYISAGVERMHGVSLKDAVNDAMVVHGQILEEDRRLISECKALSFSKMERLQLEVRYCPPSGETRWMLLSSAPRLLENDDIVEDGLAIDITDHKLHEEALLKEQARFRAMTESAQDGIAMMNPHGEISFWNPAAERIFGYSSDEVLGNHLHLLLSPERHLAAYNAAFTRFRESGEGDAVGKTLELEARCKDGREISIELSMSAFQLSDGWHSVGIIRDITERKRAEEALKESERIHTTLLNNLPGFSYRCLNDSSWTMQFVSDGCFSITGYTPEDLVNGKRISYGDIIHPDWRSYVWDRFQELLSEPEHVEIEYPIITAGGATRWVWERGQGVFGAAGELLFFEGFIMDITERKKAKEERERLQEKLYKLSKLESIGILAGGIAHNFNNILMGIRGRSSLMMIDKGRSNSDIEHLKGIEEYIKNAVELTNDLLGFARGGKYEVKPTDLNSLIEHETRLFGSTRKEIEIHGDYEGDLWAVEVDRNQMRQVLLNLCINAWQAMPGGGDLYIETKNVILDEGFVRPYSVVPGAYVIVSVADTGVGMDAFTREKIFDPFFSTKIGQGSGLGLPSVYGIIRNHGGFISVYSEKGMGSVFKVFLPALDHMTVNEVSGGEMNEFQQIEYGNGMVMLVDDEEMVLEVGRLMLQKLGYMVLVARNGKEALEVYTENKGYVDLVILDMVMPGMGGGEAFDRLKEIDQDVKVLLSTGYSIEGQAKEIMRRGCRGFIQKPFAMEEFSRKIKEVFEG